MISDSLFRVKKKNKNFVLCFKEKGASLSFFFLSLRFFPFFFEKKMPNPELTDEQRRVIASLCECALSPLSQEDEDKLV